MLIVTSTRIATQISKIFNEISRLQYDQTNEKVPGDQQTAASSSEKNNVEEQGAVKSDVATPMSEEQQQPTQNEPQTEEKALKCETVSLLHTLHIYNILLRIS